MKDTDAHRWWAIDKTGRRIGYMWPEDMESILEAYYGRRKWTNMFANEIGVARSTIDRYKNGEIPIPKHVALIIQMISVFTTKKLEIDPVIATHFKGCDCVLCMGV